MNATAVLAPVSGCALGPPRVAANSLLRYAPLLVVGLVLLGNVWQTTDPDLWGHLKFGEQMLSAGDVVRTDNYSYTAAGAEWLDHEYLTEVSIALVYNAGGVVALKLWKLLMVAAVVALLAAALAETAASHAVQLNTLAVAVAAMAPHMQFRPQLYTYAMLAGMLAVLARDNYRRFAPLWMLVPLMALWANLHGGFAIGVAVIFTYAGSYALRDLLARRHRREAIRRGMVACGCALATLATPYGTGTWRAVFTTLLRSPTFQIFADWQPFASAFVDQWRFNPFGVVVYVCFAALLVGVVAGVCLRPRAGDFPLVMVALVVAAGALKSVRNVPLGAAACALPFARRMDLLFGGQPQGFVKAPVVSSGRAQWIVAAAAILMAIAAGEFSSSLPTDMPYPSGAVEFMRAHGLSGNVLGGFEWGEYLIWHLGPESRVFIDSRYDMAYPMTVVKDYITFYYDRPGADAVLRKYPHDYVLVPTHVPAYAALVHNRRWKLAYRDRVSALFARADSAAADATTVVRDSAGGRQYFP